MIILNHACKRYHLAYSAEPSASSSKISDWLVIDFLRQGEKSGCLQKCKYQQLRIKPLLSGFDPDQDFDFIYAKSTHSTKSFDFECNLETSISM